MADMQSELDTAFDALTRGQIDAGRERLLDLCARKTSPELVALAGWELLRPPALRDRAIRIVMEFEKSNPRSDLARCLAFLHDPNIWVSPQHFPQHERSVPEAFGEPVPSQGPHEAAVAHLESVASFGQTFFVLNAAPDVPFEQTIADPALLGCALLQMRDARGALEYFDAGAMAPEKSAQALADLLAESYQSHFVDGGASLLRLKCLSGRALALRDLGDFREAHAAWLLTPYATPDRNPLLLEAERRINAVPPASAWRASANHRLPPMNQPIAWRTLVA